MTVLSRWMQDWFSYCHSHPIFWEQLLDLPTRQCHYGGHEASPTHTGDIFSHCSLLHYTKSWGTGEPRKTSHMHSNRLVMLEVALKSHEHLGGSQRQHKTLSLQVCWQTKLQRIQFATHLSTSGENCYSCHGQWIKLVKVGFRSFFFPSPSVFFSFRKSDEATSASMVVTVLKDFWWVLCC